MLREPIRVTLLVAQDLEALDVPYFVGGSLASALYGVVRSTLGADMVAELAPAHARPLARALQGAFCVDENMIAEANVCGAVST